MLNPLMRGLGYVPVNQIGAAFLLGIVMGAGLLLFIGFMSWLVDGR